MRPHVVILGLVGTVACAQTPPPLVNPAVAPPAAEAPSTAAEAPKVAAPLSPDVAFPKQPAEALIAGQWLAIGYSGFRSGQHPDRGGGASLPSQAELEEDLRLLVDHGVHLIRMYGAGKTSANVLGIIDRVGLPIKVVQGAWLRAEVSTHETCSWVTEPVPEEELAANRQANLEEIERTIALAKRHPKTVVAVNVGNEALVDWNDHLVSIESMVAYLKRVADAIDQPVTTADNYVPWAKHGPALMAVADFAFVHSYPVWEGKSLAESMAYTRANLMQVRRAIPDAPIAIGEAGWPSIAIEFGERASEENQAQYVADLLSFGRDHNMTIFVFEAFDEDWKGKNTTHPDGAEKHWGLFDINRKPKWGVRTGRLLPRPK